MINVEKLSLFNIDKFKSLYENSEDSYSCDKGFFDIYNRESFLVRYTMRKQVKLFKLNNEYIGYLWHECPDDNSNCTIYGISFKNKFLEHLTPNILDYLNLKSLKFEAIEHEKNEQVMKKLGFDIQFKSILMNLDLEESKIFEFQFPDDLQFKHFITNKDENLRCEVQNRIFNDKCRTPLTLEDIYLEENEDYFIDEFCVFLTNIYDDVLGYGQIIITKNQYTVVNFGILEQYRMKGYGEILLRYLIHLCMINSIYKIYIRVEESNNKAVNLYKKVGFTKCNTCVTWFKSVK